ncbi:MAG: DUF2085 domain-containing protein [Euryarchaeota archaeon]|nr:DUF2085 domain-containing protein [Euryarchaeota archaeon]
MKRRIHPFQSLFFVFFILYMIWILLLFLAPLVLPSGSISDLSGVVGYNTVYSAGDLFCHQKAERSLFLNGNEMPFCTRCTAIWLGLAFGLGFMVLYTIELNEKFFIAIIFSLVPLGIDGVGQLFGFWESTNIVRLLTGLPAGVICGVAIGIIFDELRSLHFFNKVGTRRT